MERDKRQPPGGDVVHHRTSRRRRSAQGTAGERQRGRVPAPPNVGSTRLPAQVTAQVTAQVVAVLCCALAGAALANATILDPLNGTVATADPCPFSVCGVTFTFEVEITGAPVDRVELTRTRDDGFEAPSLALCTPPTLVNGTPGCPDPPTVLSRDMTLQEATWTVTAEITRDDEVTSSAPIEITVLPPDLEPAGTVALSEVTPLEGETRTPLRDPRPGHPDGLASPPTEVRIIGENLDTNPFLQVRLAAIAPNEPTLTSDSALPVHQWCTYEAEILEQGSVPGGLSFVRVAVPELPAATPVTCGATPGPDVDIHRADWRWIITDNWIRPERQHAHWAIPSPRQGEAWAGAPPFRVVEPSYPRFHGFGFANHASSPRYREFLTVYGNNAYLCVGFLGACATRIPDPIYHVAWWPIYRAIIGGTDGSCNGMASTSLLMARGDLEASDFEVGVHCPFGFVDPGPDAVPATDEDGNVFMQGVARYEASNVCTPFCSPPKPANLWATIRMNHGVQISREFLLEMLDMLGEAIFNLDDITSIKGVPDATLDRVRADPQGYVLCFFEVGNGHCVTPYAVDGNRILIYENNAPGSETRFIEIEDGRYRYPQRSDDPNQGKAIMAFPIEIWEGDRNLLGLSELQALISGNVVGFLYMVAVGSGAMNVSNDAGDRWGWEADGSFSDELAGAVSIAPLGPQQVDARAMPLLLPMDQPEPTITIHADGDGPYIFHTGTDDHMYQLEAASGAGDQDHIGLAYAASGLESLRFTPERDASRLVPRVGLAVEATERALFHWHALEVPAGRSAAFAGDKENVSVTYRNDAGQATHHVLALDHASGDADSHGRTLYGPFEVPAGANHKVTLIDWPDVREARSELDVSGDGNADESDVVRGRPVPSPIDQGAAADLAVSADTDTAVARPDDEFVRTVRVTNHGPDHATDVTLLEALPDDLEVVSIVATHGECAAADELACALGDLPAGDTAHVDLTLTASRTGQMTSVATAFANEGDPDPTNNSLASVIRIAEEVAELRVGRGPDTPQTIDARPGDSDVPVMHVELEVLSDEAVSVSALELAVASERALTDLAVNVYRGANDDGSSADGATLLATGAITGGEDRIVVQLSDFTLPPGGRAPLLITLDLGPAPFGNRLAVGASLIALGIGASLWRRRRLLAGAIAVAGLLLALASCRTEPQPPAGTTTTIDVSLRALDGSGTDSGAPANVTGLPIEGATVRIAE